ncbi:unnamed protein product [Ectocarpus sp. CCAP 1310/34]|nr:unnamed protein product [Ectocarpus sp. CCAP 1310/34]
MTATTILTQLSIGCSSPRIALMMKTDPYPGTSLNHSFCPSAPSHDGILEDSAKAIVGAVESVANNEIVQNAGEVVGDAVGVVHDALREGVKTGTEVVHGAVRAMNQAGGVASRGMPDIEGVEERAESYADLMETQAEWADSAAEAFDRARENAPDVLRAVDPDGTLEEVVEEVTQEAGEAVVEILGEK